MSIVLWEIPDFVIDQQEERSFNSSTGLRSVAKLVTPSFYPLPIAVLLPSLMVAHCMKLTPYLLWSPT
jgi:hypothetical protein